MLNISSTNRSVLLRSFLPLLVVYIVWGTTFLAIRITVREGSGFPPFVMGASRMLVAGVLFMVWAGLSGQRIKASRTELVIVAASGILIWNGGNGTVTWAERQTDSGFVALITGALPIWVAITEALLDRRMLSRLVIGGLLIGMAGLALLTIPAIREGTRGVSLVGVIVLLSGSIAFGAGSILQRRKSIDLTPQVSAGYLHFAGALGYTVLSLSFHEPLPTPSAQAWGAWVYLVIFGSLLGFTAFVMALRLLPNRIVATHAYVNPVVAVFLGWLILNESISVLTVAGAALILLGVAVVFRGRYVQVSSSKAAL